MSNHFAVKPLTEETITDYLTKNNLEANLDDYNKFILGRYNEDEDKELDLIENLARDDLLKNYFDMIVGDNPNVANLFEALYVNVQDGDNYHYNGYYINKNVGGNKFKLTFIISLFNFIRRDDYECDEILANDYFVFEEDYEFDASKGYSSNGHTWGDMVINFQKFISNNKFTEQY